MSSMHDERWDMTITEAGNVRLRDLQTGAAETFSGPRALFDALGLLADWRDAYLVPDKSHYGASVNCEIHGDECAGDPAQRNVHDYGATADAWCECDWLGEGTPRHAPSPTCIALRPDGPRS